MPLSIKYFSPTGVGDKSGGSATNAAQAISADEWTADFKDVAPGTEMRLLPGTYRYITPLVITLGPTRSAPLFIVGCDNSGVPLSPKRNTSGFLDHSLYPLLEASGDGTTIHDASYNRQFVTWQCLQFNVISDSDTDLLSLNANNNVVGCVFHTSSGSSRSVHLLTAAYVNIINCDYYFKTNINYIFSSSVATASTSVRNCIFSGDLNFSCVGFTQNSFRTSIIDNIFYNIRGPVVTGSDSTPLGIIHNNLFININSSAIVNTNTTNANSIFPITNNVFYNISGYAIHAGSTGVMFRHSYFNNYFYNCANGFSVDVNLNQVPTGVLISGQPLDLNSSVLPIRYSPVSLLKGTNPFGKDLGPCFAPQFLSSIG